MSGVQVNSTSRKRTTSATRSSSERLDSTSTGGKTGDSGCSSVEERESDTSFTDVPPNTSLWTEKILSSLGVVVVSSSISSPINIMESVFVGPVHLLKYHKIEAKQFRQDILSNPSKGWENLKKYTTLSDILEADLGGLESEITDLNKLETDKDKAVEDSTWLSLQVTFLPTKWFTTFRLQFCRFYVMGEQFSRYLLYMAETKQRGGTITEKMYQHLFSLFLGMFGLLVNPAPETGNLQIRSENIVSVSDVIVSQAQKILAVIMIKSRETCVEEGEPPKKTSKINEEVDERQNMSHLDEHIVGQVGGDMLVHLRASASGEEKILGIMVQETFVTFTYLEKREKLRNEDGNYIMKSSKPYNYLDPKEREDLMEPLILLSLLQNNPKFLN